MEIKLESHIKTFQSKKEERFFRKNINEFDNNLDKLFIDKYLYLFKGSNSTGLNKVLSKEDLSC